VSSLEQFCQQLINATRTGFDSLSAYIDLDYMLWIKWLLSPLILTILILPSFILLFIYMTALTLYIYRKHRQRLLRRLHQTVFEVDLTEYRTVLGTYFVSVLFLA
jgi:hypothetical protein